LKQTDVSEVHTNANIMVMNKQHTQGLLDIKKYVKIMRKFATPMEKG
jgi:hypothetical protein